MPKRLPLKPGTLVDQYLVEGVLGGGGFSIVYHCSDTKSRDRVVLKEYFPNQISQRIGAHTIEPINDTKVRSFQVGMAQFFTEAQALAKIHHPNIINITSIFRAHGTVYMVCKLEAGKDLKWFIKNCPDQLDQAFVQKAILPVMSGINALHAKKLLHLDIKPANIFLRTAAGPLLLDFGASTTMNEDERFSSFQTLTPGFAPPEQHRGQALGPGSDIYALGATIYACITGGPPPTSLTREENKWDLALKDADKRISQSVIDSIHWALEMDIKKRPQSLVEFADTFIKDMEWASFSEYEDTLLNP